MIEVETREELGEWLGHCKYDKEGKPRKVKGCSSIAIKNFGEDTEALSFVRHAEDPSRSGLIASSEQQDLLDQGGFYFRQQLPVHLLWLGVPHVQKELMNGFADFLAQWCAGFLGGHGVYAGVYGFRFGGAVTLA